MTAYVINGWPSTRPQVKAETELYWLFHDDMVVSDDVIKARRIAVPDHLQQRALQYLHINHVDIEMIRLLATESMYWVKINAGIEMPLKATPFEFQTTQLKDKPIPDDIPGKPWETVGELLNNKMYLCIVGCHSKFPVLKLTDGISCDSLFRMCRIVFADHQIPRKLMLDASTNFASEKFHEFCRCLNIHHAVSSSYNNQNNGPALARINSSNTP